MKRILFLVLLIYISLLACKKYQDNPLLDIGSVDSRIEGVWDVQYIFVNGIDSTAFLKGDTCYRHLKFLSVSQSTSNTNLVSSSQNYTSCDIYGHYAFINDKDDLAISIYNCGFRDIGFYGFQNAQSIVWKINKLTSGQMWLERESNGINCWIHFIKQ